MAILHDLMPLRQLCLKTIQCKKYALAILSVDNQLIFFLKSRHFGYVSSHAGSSAGTHLPIGQPLENEAMQPIGPLGTSLPTH